MIPKYWMRLSTDCVYRDPPKRKPVRRYEDPYGGGPYWLEVRTDSGRWVLSSFNSNELFQFDIDGDPLFVPVVGDRDPTSQTGG